MLSNITHPTTDVPLPRIYAWFSALVAEDYTLLEDLLTHGFPIDIPHPLRHTTALMEATRRGHATLIEWLLAHGAAPAFLSGLPQGTPLHCALHHHLWCAALQLLQAMNSTAVMDAHGRTPLHMLCMDTIDDVTIPKVVEIAECIITKGCPLDLLDHEGLSVLHYASVNNMGQMAELLLMHGANPNAQVPDTGMTPLMMAALEKNMLICALLMRHGGDLQLTNKDGASALKILPALEHMPADYALCFQAKELTALSALRSAN